MISFLASLCWIQKQTPKVVLLLFFIHDDYTDQQSKALEEAVLTCIYFWISSDNVLDHCYQISSWRSG